MEIKGKIVDVVKKEIYNGLIKIENGRIIDIIKIDEEQNRYIIPGFIDSHVHIESSMLIPTRFAGLSVKNGTVGVVCDPHEIANVLGEQGVIFMVENSKKSPLKFFFGVPSCVPATSFETSGAVMDSNVVGKLLARDDLFFLAEMMNYPGVIFEDPDVMAKLDAAKKINKPIDGHAPGLRGEELKKYIQAGITTDHEAYTLEEAEEKIKLGMKILIREGSAAKNFDALHPLIAKYPEMVMFCTDDSHPDDLVKGHINRIVKKAIEQGHDLFNVLSAASLNPKLHYNLNVGLLQPGDSADFIIVEDLKGFEILETYINGLLVYSQKHGINFKVNQESPVNKFEAKQINQEDLKIKRKGQKIRVIKAMDKQLITGEEIVEPRVAGEYIVPDTKRDILKIVVVNRYTPNAKPAIGFISGFGLKRGAIAATIAHDSHNIIAIGCSDTEITDAINKLVEIKGGIVANNGMGEMRYIKLNFAGLMADIDGEKLAGEYAELKKFVKDLGTDLNSPLMTMSFMALPVIPKLKMTDKGLFDSEKFKKVDLFV